VDLKEAKRTTALALRALGEPNDRATGLARTKLEEAKYWLEQASTQPETGPEKASRLGKVAREKAGLEA